MHYYNCLVEVLYNNVSGFPGVGRKIYAVTHESSAEQLFATSLEQAIKIARLLELEYRVMSLMPEYTE